MAQTFPTFGYRKDGKGAIFDLPTHDAPLPAGWHRCITTIQDEAKRTAEAISEAGILTNPPAAKAAKAAAASA